MAKLSVLALIMMLAICARGALEFKLPNLPYDYSGLENWIDTETMTIHHQKHHGAAVTNLNKAIAEVPDLARYMLTPLLQNIGSLKIPTNVTRAIRNNGGSHFNHAMFWRTMRPSWYDFDPSRPKNVPSSALRKAINKSYGSMANFQTAFSDAATKLFGSGWTWLCLQNKNLVIITTPNQDNPLMRHIVDAPSRCTPILGLDVWEHAYYLKHRNVRANYITAWWNVVNWPQVSKNYVWAQQGQVEKLWYGD